jgi:4-amino-4-deoxy-L-arabinose transferase-like glycosyltransferase
VAPERITASTGFRYWLANNRFVETASVHSIGLVLILIIAAALRLYDLDHVGLWFDEAASWYQANQPLGGVITGTASLSPPLHNIILHFTIAAFGDSETSLRAPSALLGIATVYLIYRVGTMLWDRTTGLIAAFFLSMSSFHIWYSREARMYALLAFTTTLFLYAALYAARYPSRIRLAGCALAGVLLLHSHPYGIFVFAAINAVVVTALLTRATWIKLNWKEWIASQLLTTIAFSPWLVLLFHRTQQIASHGFWIPAAHGAFVLSQLKDLAGGRLPLIVLTVLVLLATFLSPVKEDGWVGSVLRIRLFDWRKCMLVSMICVPILGAYLVSLAVQPILLARYLICVLPALLLLAASGLCTMRLDRSVLIPAAVAVVATFLPWVIKGIHPGDSDFDFRDALFHSSELVDDFRSAVREFSKRYAATDRVLLLVHEHDAALRIAPFMYYWRYSADVQSYYEVGDIDKKSLDINRLWIFSLWEPTQDLQATLSNARHREVYSSKFEGLNVSLFQGF